MTKILSKEEAKKLDYFREYPNKDYSYKTEDDYCHLIRNWKDLLEGKNAIDVRILF